MKLIGSFSSLVVASSIFLCMTTTHDLQAKDKEMTAEQVIASHVKSIGPSDVLAGLKNRGVSGQAVVNFIQGGVGKLSGQAMILSAGPSMGIIMKYGGVDYPGEYLAFNGKDVSVSNIKPGQRSPLGDFIFRYNQVMKEGLLGGVFSMGWPLLDIEHKKVNLKYDTAKVDGRELHVIEFMPKSGMNGIKVKMYFDPETFHHLRTEYRLKVRGEQGLQAGKTVTEGILKQDQIGSGSSGITRNAGILDAVADSNYLLVEKFENFKEVEKMMLPQRYTIEYSTEGEGSSFLGNWTIDAGQWILNGQIDQSLFKAK